MRRNGLKTADGIRVYCGFTRLEEPGKLQRHPKAFHDHSKAQRAVLAEIIEGNGWREPVTVSKRSGFVTRGYARILAAQDKGWKQVPIDEQQYASEAAELADAVADTRIQEFSKLDDEKLRQIIVKLKKKDFNLRLTGLDANIVDSILAEYEKGLRMEMQPLDGTGQEGIRQVILIYDKARHEQFVEAIDKIEKKQSIESLSQLCITLLRTRKRNEADHVGAQAHQSAGVRAKRGAGKRRTAKNHRAVQGV
jgi:hypothetical protein